jgi:TolB-like protein
MSRNCHRKSGISLRRTNWVANPSTIRDHSEAEGDTRHARGRLRSVSGAVQAVFISYASQDAEAANRICQALRAAGIEVWFDQSELRGGDAWDQKIRREIRDCALFVPVISANTASRHEGYFRLEWDLADQRTHMMARDRAFIVPVCLDATTDAGTDVPESFHRAQWTRLPDGNTPPAFAARVVSLLGAPSAAAPTADSSPSVAMTGHRAPPALAPAATAKSALRENRLAMALLAAIAVVLAYVAIDRLWLSKHAPAEKPAAAVAPAPTAAALAITEKSIAVLPFADMSEKHDQEYFSDGLAEELLNQLATTPGLRVIARTSSFYFKGKQATVTEIGRTLGVANILEGSVRKSGNRLRVTTQLVRAANGEHLWSETYDRELRDIFNLQEEISASVVKALRVTLTGEVRSGQSIATSDLEAYDLYLRSMSERSKNTRASLAAAGHYAEQAMMRDPKFALAPQAAAYAMLLRADSDFVPPNAGYERTRQLALQALALDPNLAEAHAILGYVHHVYDWDWKAAAAEFQIALGKDPTNEMALRCSALLAGTLGQTDQAEQQLRAVLANNPLNKYAMFNLGFTLYKASHYRESEQVYRTLLEIEPEFSWTRPALAETLVALGRPEDALAIAREEPEEENRLGVLAIALDVSGKRRDADDALQILSTRYGGTSAFSVAMIYANRADAGHALEWLERAYKQHDALLVDILGERPFRTLATDPRYQAFLRKMNLPQ